MKNQRLIITVMSLALFGGCGHAIETVKVLWGSSTKALEEARTDALRKNFQCTPDAGMDAVVEMTKVKPLPVAEQSVTEPSSPEPNGQDTSTTPVVAEPPAPAPLKLFLQKRKQGLLVIMGVPGVINTTEVGVFFVATGEGQTRVEVSSLSGIAKHNAADFVFKELAKRFPVVEDKN